jgi:hypothetical protein
MSASELDATFGLITMIAVVEVEVTETTEVVVELVVGFYQYGLRVLSWVNTGYS